MSRAPRAPGATGKAIEQAVGKALDPFATAIRKATQGPATLATPAAPGKPGLKVSPLAVPFPAIPGVGGVEMTTARAGFYKHERDDLVVFRFARGTSCAGVFTRHKVGSAPVDWCRRHLDAAGGGQDVRALVVNAGCANAFTGKAGADAARRTASEVAKRFGCRQRDVMLASTEVIGVLLDDRKIVARLVEVEQRLDGDTPASEQWAAAGRGIMTTDTFPKGSFAECKVDGYTVRIAGIAKGSGMIAPDMATMLAFIVTDADIHPTVLRALLGLHVRTTFNSVTVDGDTSTNDTCLLFATGTSGAPRIGRVGDRRLKAFSAALDKVMLDLAHQLVRDGEGASKFVRITVEGAASPASARKLAKSIADSPLVKTAIAGEDANWGRIVMAVGKTEEPVDRDHLAIRFGPHQAAVDGAVSSTYDEAKMTAYMKNAEIDIVVDVGMGRASATVWTCDLTKGYIEINGDYRS
ncbi:MAG: bifunctional ornithine acetyltransferase/N-acetylglutamate synthase [Brevundimonas subvibrioides]|uniref:Arginine biosynthesis bifunctional protein ArgJ n=1 Tax=Brevundimonas subvibrioides TaxID=74313 RepID=A0A258FEP5_9CAUL|nr:MAG: bifunctional ornithine acetyltransferase/N-acetylglutamate synthase [Brevundimonas subvibrioides]